MIETYICARCDGEFAKIDSDEWNDAMAIEEAKQTFGPDWNQDEDAAIICEDCYQILIRQLNN